MRKIKYGYLLLLTILLSSCSTVHRDGPPKFYVDETKVPNAVPKPEPLAKYGNMSHYYVFGKRYDTLASSKNYDVIGTASWYGMQFHKHLTSSGERYDVLGMTAAHKTLPLPTYVEVTNLRNHRQIIVKVNDRGPFEGNRLIDLSYVAAKKLQMLGHGTTLVRVRAIDPYTYHPHQLYQPYRPQPVVAENNAPIYLQAGAFHNRMYAEQLKTHLVTLLNAPVQIFTPSMTNHFYRVQIGPLQDMAAVNEITNRLNNLGIKTHKQLAGV